METEHCIVIFQRLWGTWQYIVGTRYVHCKCYGMVKGVGTACKVIQIVLFFYQFYINIFYKTQKDERCLMSDKKQITLFYFDKHIGVSGRHFGTRCCTTYSTTLQQYVLHETVNFCYIFLIISACNKGFFGADCNEKCGHCREIYQCHHINV